MRTGFKKTGFILVELIIATAILAAVIPLSKFFIDTIKFARKQNSTNRQSFGTAVYGGV